jgi:hypothetical protein
MTAALGILMLALAACGSAATSNAPGTANPVSPGTSTKAASPSQPVTWQPGGSWTDEFPPQSFAGSSVALPEYKTSDGYAYSGRVTFGVPLHSHLPATGFNCSDWPPDTAMPVDIKPGQYVIPIAVRINNLIGQQAPAMAPQIAFSVPRFSNTLDGWQGTWSEGYCGSVTIGADGYDTYYALISIQGSPYGDGLTPADIRGATVSIDWIPSAQNYGDPSEHVLTRPLASLLPAQARTWLAGQP